jgi:SAM-dependent methyltransferase
MAKAPFDHVTREYEQARPSYPDGVFDAIEAAVGPLAGRVVIEGGAGTGIATRQLAAHGPRLVAFDLSRPMLDRARRPDAPPFVVADGATLPFRSGSAHLLCFAQAWHWLDPGDASAEAARVVRPGGAWAAWWTHAWPNGEPWFETYRVLLDEACPAYGWQWREHDWGATLGARDAFAEPVATVVRWVRTMTVESFLTGMRSHSAVAALPADALGALLAGTEGLLRDTFGDDPWPVDHETTIWTARRLP